MGRILQVNYSFSITAAEYRRAMEEMAAPTAAFPGLLWKIWLIDEEAHRAGGLLLFDSAEAATEYQNGLSPEHLPPFITDVVAHQFDWLAGPTAITHGPVPSALAAARP